MPNMGYQTPLYAERSACEHWVSKYFRLHSYGECRGAFGCLGLCMYHGMALLPYLAMKKPCISPWWDMKHVKKGISTR